MYVFLPRNFNAASVHNVSKAMNILTELIHSLPNEHSNATEIIIIAP